MILPALFALSGCLAVSPGSDQITARDFVPAFPEMARLAPETPVAFAPVPGVTRVFRASDLQRLAAKFELGHSPEADICFARTVAPLDEERLVAAMRHQLPEAHIEILEFSRTAAPEGEIQFPLAGLRHGAIGQTWNGWVTYAGNRRFPIWARVKVTVSTRVVVAAADLKAGAAIEASQLHIETRDNLPGISFLASTADVEGRVLRRAVAAGTPIQPQWLEAAKDVTRGDQVKVEVRSGNARLELTGEAEASGAAGQTIPVLNPISKKRFRARIEGKGRVVVEQGVS